MERSSFSFTYKGCIADAITEAQMHKKLFVVYISGDDDASTSLEQSTWMDQRVAESISKYCIFLHLAEGTVDALQFSAIYLQKSIPSISAIGYNGVMIWQHEGFISAENLVESVEKAWATLHLQGTAAALLTAALASKKSELSTSSIISSSENGSSSSSNVASTSTNNFQNSDDIPLTNFAETENEVDERISEKDNNFDEKKISSAGSYAIATTISAETSTKSCDPGPTHGNPGVTSEGEENGKSGNIERATDSSVASESTPKSDGNNSVHHGDSQSQRNLKTIPNEVERTKEEKAEGSARSSNAIKATDVHLNIRLPNGSCLQMRFPFTDTLQSVKNYVDENAASSLGAYDLAVPYPRKIFMEQDMAKTMSELGFASREALIVVPHQHATVAWRAQSPSYDINAPSETDPSDSDNGYFVFVKRILSYINPFSYFGGTSRSSSPEPGPSALQYQGPTAFQNNQSLVGGSYRPYVPGESDPQPGNNANMARRRTSSRFGGNVHTLRDVEGEDSSSDRNVFWNGNSTQFGGDDKN